MGAEGSVAARQQQERQDQQGPADVDVLRPSQAPQAPSGLFGVFEGCSCSCSRSGGRPLPMTFVIGADEASDLEDNANGDEEDYISHLGNQNPSSPVVAVLSRGYADNARIVGRQNGSGFREDYSGGFGGGCGVMLAPLVKEHGCSQEFLQMSGGQLPAQSRDWSIRVPGDEVGSNVFWECPQSARGVLPSPSPPTALAAELPAWGFTTHAGDRRDRMHSCSTRASSGDGDSSTDSNFSGSG
eukprot:TRINITY_DN70274_c0_g1_i1.p1 TRINITY_DN70274_c0_g1~~TRINITY_DN70274_c0_g1_i1.p1  ORF type:complete len:270 (-),score=44.05 TRINITY_DN70274_c0_g1_i1:58-783(-)